MGNKTRILSAFLGVWSTLLLHTLTVHAVVLSDSTSYNRYAYIYIINDDEPNPTLTDEQFFDHAASITFPVAVSRLPKNDDLLNELRTTVIPQINGDSLQLVSMMMRGAASPEGSVDLNRRLGGERVQALLQFFSDNLRFPLGDDVLSVDNAIEDYRSLCLLMRRADDPDYATVKGLCDSFLDSDLSRLKQKLMAEQGGRLWQRLLNTYFPQLRTARFIIVLRKYTPKPAEPLTVPAVPIEPIAPIAPIKPTEPIEPITPIEPIESIEPIAPILPAEPLDSILPRRELLSVKTNLLFYALYMPGYDRWCPIPNVAIEYYPKGGHFTFGASFDMPWWQDYDAHKYFQLRNYQVEARYYLRSSTPKSEVYSRKSEVYSPESEVYGLASEVYSPKSEVYSPESEVYGRTSEVYSPESEVRSPKSSPAFSGFYASAYVHGGLFGICFDANRGWVGEGYGAGLGVGYVTPISRNGHWRLEFGLQAGFFRCKYDPYQYGNPVTLSTSDDLYYYKWTQGSELFKKRQYRWNWLGPTRIGVTLTYDLLYRRIHKKGASFKNKEKLPQQPH
ncbi:MAG: DUF3575 domain-containing protein [Prevotella sp.]|nr:DUF3575 domain-containing protein [Prevotella sp.]